MPALYESDFHAWAFEEARKLRAGEPVDSTNIAEELETLGRSERRDLINTLAVLFTHLLKWEYQPDRRTRSWTSTIRVQQKHARRLLRDNPSLKPLLAGIMADAYDIAVSFAAAETRMVETDFPPACPFTEETITTDWKD